MRVLGVVAGAQAREALPLLVGGAFAAGHSQQQRAAAAAVGRIDFFTRRVCEACKQQQSGAVCARSVASQTQLVRRRACSVARCACRSAGHAVGPRAAPLVCPHVCTAGSFDAFCERDHVDA